MASFLASFATGFDIRISNIKQNQPIQHPRLHNIPQLSQNEFDVHHSPLYKDIYPHEKDMINVGSLTYHGHPSKQKMRYD